MVCQDGYAVTLYIYILAVRNGKKLVTFTSAFKYDGSNNTFFGGVYDLLYCYSSLATLIFLYLETPLVSTLKQ